MGAKVELLPGAAGFGTTASLTGQIAGTKTGADDRATNAIAYVSPTFAGLSLTAAYVANENKTFHGQEPAANTTGYDAGLKYANGPIMAAVTYNAVSMGNAAKTDISDFRVGASYDFGMASIRGIFDRARADHFGGAGYTQNVFGLGGTFNVTPAGKIIGQFYFADEMKRNGKDQKDTGAKLFEIGYEHSLSKRTILKAVYAHLNNDANAGYDFGINAVGLNATTFNASRLLGPGLAGLMIGVWGVGPAILLNALLVAVVWYTIITTILSIAQYYIERYYARGTVRVLPPTPLQRARHWVSIQWARLGDGEKTPAASATPTATTTTTGAQS